MIIITARVKAEVVYTVESVCEGDAVAITLAATEYGYHADILAKSLSKSPIYNKPNFAIIVRRFGAEYGMAFCQGKKIATEKHWAWQLKWGVTAR